MTKLFAPLICLLLLTASVHGVRAEDKSDKATQQVDDLKVKTEEDQRILNILKKELERNFSVLKNAKPPVHFMAYRLYETESSEVSAEYGALFTRKNREKERTLQIEVRIGSKVLDSTHYISSGSDDSSYRDHGIPLGADDLNLRNTLWLETENQYRSAAERYGRVIAEQGLTSEDTHCDDFSSEESTKSITEAKLPSFDLKVFEEMARKLSSIFKDYKPIEMSWIRIEADQSARYLVNTEGTCIANHSLSTFFHASATATADDGEQLRLEEHCYVPKPDKIMDGFAEYEKIVKDIADNIVALRKASPADVYYGPAILNNRAAAVLFHEALGHRLEAHRLRRMNEGKTFQNMLGKQILPKFISVYDRPLQPRLGDEPLVGHYLFDDDGVPAKDVTLVDGGILKSFLVGRTPVPEFPKSNGHGRCQPGGSFQTVARMGNLMVASSKKVSEEALRKDLIAEVKKRKKPYGLIVEEVVSGETNTTDFNPQSFNLRPSLVRKVYADGRPDELVRSVRIIGTPMAALERIIETSDKVGVFNGACGAESGWVPQANCAPSILIDGLEIERTNPGKNVKPVLPPPDFE